MQLGGLPSESIPGQRGFTGGWSTDLSPPGSGGQRAPWKAAQGPWSWAASWGCPAPRVSRDSPPSPLLPQFQALSMDIHYVDKTCV